MGLQERGTPISGLVMASLYKLIGLMNKRKNIIDNVFLDFFKSSVDTQNGWYDVKYLFELHDLSGVMPTGQSPSKDLRQSDANQTSFMLNRSKGAIEIMYQMALDADIILNTVDLWYEVKISNDQTEIQRLNENYNKWSCLISAYEVLYLIEAESNLIIDTLSVLLNSGGAYELSPAQIMYYSGNYMHGSLINTDSSSTLNTYPWSTINNILTATNLEDIIKYDRDSIWWEAIPSLSFSGSTSTTLTQSVSADAFREEFIQDDGHAHLKDKFDITSLGGTYFNLSVSAVSVTSGISGTYGVNSIEVNVIEEYSDFAQIIADITGDPGDPIPNFVVQATFTYNKINVT